MFRPSGETLELTEEQFKRAKELYQLSKAEDLCVPDDLFESWKCMESPGDSFERILVGERERSYVSPSNIVGWENPNPSRFRCAKLRKVLGYMGEGKFELEADFPPKLIQTGNELYVSADGLHRSVAAKYIGLDRLFATVQEVRFSNS